MIQRWHVSKYSEPFLKITLSWFFQCQMGKKIICQWVCDLSYTLFNSQKKYLNSILKTVKILRNIDDPSKNLTINCTGGIILYTIEQCGPDDSPEHVSKRTKKKEGEFLGTHIAFHNHRYVLFFFKKILMCVSLNQTAWGAAYSGCPDLSGDKYTDTARH